MDDEQVIDISGRVMVDVPQRRRARYEVIFPADEAIPAQHAASIDGVVFILRAHGRMMTNSNVRCCVSVNLSRYPVRTAVAKLLGATIERV
jgi:hypothetical protein